MNSNVHLLLATTVSMIMTLILHCTLKETRANGLYFEHIFVDSTRDELLHTRCLCHHGKGNKTCDYLITDRRKNLLKMVLLPSVLMFAFFFYDIEQIRVHIRPWISTIFGAWFVARCCDAIHLDYPVDVLTTYFLIWQFASVIVKWELQELPLLSVTLYRGWFCISTAFIAFIAHDVIFRYLSTQLVLGFMWILSVEDIIACLHPQGRLYNLKVTKARSVDDSLTCIPGHYYTGDFDDDLSSENDNGEYLGLADMMIFNLMFLLVLPPLSSLRTKMFVTIGYMIAVHIGQEATVRLGRICYIWHHPALPLPVVAVSIYAIALDTFIQC